MTTPCPKTTFPTLLQQFFLERLIQQRNVSPQTVAAYRDSFCLLLRFAQRHLGKARPRATGRIEFSARLLLNSSSGCSRKRVSFCHRVSV